MKAINVLTDQTWEFDKATAPEWAVRYAWADDHDMLPTLFDFQNDDRQDLIERHFPVVEGARTVMIGDIGAFKKH